MDPRVTESTGARGRPRALVTDAIVWKRIDFRESSRIVTFLTRDHGRVQALAKGAHRPNSPLLGRLDLFNEVRIALSADRGGLRTLLRLELRHERRALREPGRFFAASHLAELCDRATHADRPDPELHDLCSGGLSLLEKAPLHTLPTVVLGLELRLLAHLGQLPDLDHCSTCGAPLDNGGFVGADGALGCRSHAPSPRSALPARALERLRNLLQLPGRRLPAAGDEPGSPAATSACGRWLELALERTFRLRPRVHESSTS